MPRFKHYNYDQDAMVVINYQEQLQPGSFEHAVHYLIEHKLDLSVFHPKYRNEDTGRLAYDPAILLKTILSPIPKASPPAARCSGAARPTSSSKPCPATPFPTSPRWPSSSAITRMRLKSCSSKCCWCVTSRACWVTNSSPSTAAKCPHTQPHENRPADGRDKKLQESGVGNGSKSVFFTASLAIFRNSIDKIKQKKTCT